METKHTPGPWSEDDGHIYTKNKHGFNSEFNSIATLHEIYSDDLTPQSNRKLIVAAPDMLDCIKKIQAAGQLALCGGDNGLHSFVSMMLMNLNEVIKTTQ